MKKISLSGFLMFSGIIIALLGKSSVLTAQTTDIIQLCTTDIYGCTAGSFEIVFNFDGGSGPDSALVIENIRGYRYLDTGEANKQYRFFSPNNFAPCSDPVTIDPGEFHIKFKYNGSFIAVNKVDFRIYGASTTNMTVTAYQGTTETTISGDDFTSYYKYECESAATPFDYIKIVCTHDAITDPSAGAFALDELHIPTEPPANNPPTDITLSSASVNENLADEEVGTLTTTDPDAGDSHTYDLIAGTGDTDNLSFTIVDDVLKTLTGLNYEIPPSHTRSVRIRTTDPAGASFEKVFTITVNDIAENSPPTDLTLSNQVIDENNPCGALIGTLSTSDTDAGDSFIYSLVTGTGDTDNSFFTIYGNELRAGTIFNNEAKSLYSIRLRTTDGAGSSYEEVFSISINNIDPEGTPEVICLLDLSGSMDFDFYYHSASDPTKVKLAQTKSSFYGFLDALYALLPVNVNIGLARFPNYPQMGCDAGNLSSLNILDDIYKANLESIANSFFAYGSTPLLAGIDMARSMFGTGSRKVILLLTDGIHNCPSSASAGIINTYAETLRAAGISVYTIGFGTPDYIPNNILNALASGTCGINFDITALKANYDPDSPDPWDPATALDAAFASIIVNGLGLSATIDPLDIIKQGTKEQFIVPVTDLDDKICFYISWVKQQENYLGVKLITPGGNELPLSVPGVTYTNKINYKVITLSQDLIEQPGMTGNWQLEIDGSGISDSTEHYQFTVINTSQRLKLNTWSENGKYYTGNSIRLFLELLYQGERITGIDKITAGGTGPGISLGNWLTSKQVTLGQIEIAKKKIADEQISWMIKDPVIARFDNKLKEKYLGLQKQKFIDGLDPVTVRSWIMRNDYKLVYPTRIIIDGLQFNDDGQNGDQSAGDGIYTAVYVPSKEGTYHFNISAVESRDGRNIQRENQLEVYVHTKIRLKKFIKEIKLTDEIIGGERIFNVILDLRDINGNVPVPSTLDEIKVSFDKGKPIGGIIDNMDGTFSQKVAIAGNIKLKNVRMKLKADEDSGEQKLSSGQTWIYGVAVVILAALGILLGRRKK